MKRWRSEIQKLVDFAKERPAIQRQHLKEFFDLGEPYELVVRVMIEDEDGRTRPIDKGAVIELNTLTLGVSDDELEKPVAASARATNMEKYLAFPWKGEYFAGMPIRLNISPREGYQFSHWEGQGITADIADESHIELTPHSDSIVTAILKKDP